MPRFGEKSLLLTEGVDRSTAWPLLLRCRHYDALGPERLRDPLRALRGGFREVVNLPQDPHIAESRVLNRRQVLHLHGRAADAVRPDRKSTRLNSSHRTISYAVFCLKKKKKI